MWLTQGPVPFRPADTGHPVEADRSSGRAITAAAPDAESTANLGAAGSVRAVSAVVDDGLELVRAGEGGPGGCGS